MPKCDFNTVAKQFYGNHTLAWMLSCKFVAYFLEQFFLRTLLALFLTVVLKFRKFLISKNILKVR